MAAGLKHDSRVPGVGAAARPAAAPASTFPSQCLGEFLRRIGKVDPHPAVLDLGILCGDNIAFLGARGCRVSVESLPSATATKPPAAAQAPADPKDRRALPLSPLQYPPESFSGVLAWDAIARMSPADAAGFVACLGNLLLEGGVVLAYFPPASSGSTGARYRIVSSDLLAVEPSTRRFAPLNAFQNREIYSMFTAFDVVRLSQLKSGAREVLAVRTRRNGS